MTDTDERTLCPHYNPGQPWCDCLRCFIAREIRTALAEKVPTVIEERDVELVAKDAYEMGRQDEREDWNPRVGRTIRERDEWQRRYVAESEAVHAHRARAEAAEAQLEHQLPETEIGPVLACENLDVLQNAIIGIKRGQIQLLARAEAAESKLADLQTEVAELRAEHPSAHMTCDTHLQLAHERAEAAEAKLARAMPVVEAALAWDRGGDGFGGEALEVRLADAVAAFLAAMEDQ